MISPVSVMTGRDGVTASPKVDSKAIGAPATSVSSTFFQSSPDRFWTMPQTCKSAPDLPTTTRYDGRHSGVVAT
jgi:hypothetical protein